MTNYCIERYSPSRDVRPFLLDAGREIGGSITTLWFHQVYIVNLLELIEAIAGAVTTCDIGIRKLSGDK